MVIFNIIILPTGACEIANTLYYRAWVGARETLCTCHRLFLLFLNRACMRVREREREPGSSNNQNNILSKILKTNMLNIVIFKTASSYSDTAVIHRY